jgi:hypothetical protein
MVVVVVVVEVQMLYRFQHPILKLSIMIPRYYMNCTITHQVIIC